MLLLILPYLFSNIEVNGGIKGLKIKINAKDLLAQALCHEIDHLNGITFVDKMIPGTLEYVEPKEN